MRAETLTGMPATWSGCSAISMLAPLPVLVMERTSPTIRPRILTSELFWSWLPIRSACRVTNTTGVNFFWNEATARPTRSRRVSRNATP